MSVSARRKREKAERRQTILAAAAEVFAGKGFAQATMEEVAVAAELSKGTLYLYFKNKDDLFLALSADVISLVMQDFESIAASEAPADQRLRRMLLAYAARAEGHPDHFRSMVVFLSSGHAVDTATPTFAAHRERIAGVMSALAGVLAEGQDEGCLRADFDAATTVSQLWGGLFGVLQIYVNREKLARRFPHPIDFESFIPGYVDLLIAGLRSSP